MDDKESPIIHELRTNRSWQEAVCITSGYGALLMRHFDRAVDQLVRRGRMYWADPQRTRPGETNTEHGGRGLYVMDPAGHGVELITRPYL